MATNKESAMTRSFNFISPKSFMNLVFFVTGLALFALGLPTAHAQTNTTICGGSCPTPVPSPMPTFTLTTSMDGWTAGVSTAATGKGGKATISSFSQDMLKMEAAVTGSGGPSGLCGQGCAGNSATFTLNAGVMAGSSALHEVTSSNATGPTTSSASSASHGGSAFTGTAGWSLAPAPKFPVAATGTKP